MIGILQFLIAVSVSAALSGNQNELDKSAILQEVQSSISVLEPSVIDSCAVVLDSLIFRSQVDPQRLADSDFKGLIEYLLELEPDSGSYEELRLNSLVSRAKDAFNTYLLSLDELPEDVAPDVMLDEIEGQAVVDSLEELSLEDTSGMAADSVALALEVERLKGKQLPPVPLVLNQQVENAISYYCHKGRKVVQRWFDRSAEMVPKILPILREEGLPDEMVNLAMIESGFNVNAYSYAHASGPWQFITGTGRRYGLDIDWWYDERRDPEKATRAAAAYLRELYAMFDDWYLAMAAYNCGERKVEKHVRLYGRDFWRLKRLPHQTRNYVPSFIAAAIIAQDPERYGFHRPDLIPPMAFERVFLDECVDLNALADAAGTDAELLKALNPALLRWCVPPDRDSVEVRFPVGSVGIGFWEKYRAIPPEKKVSYISHRVSRGETLSSIARRYGVPMRMISDQPQNRIRNLHKLSVGQILIIPGIAGKGAQRSKTVIAVADETPMNVDEHVVKRGDTLGGIAAKHGKRIEDLRAWNNLSGNTIYPNQKLVLTGDEGRAPISIAAAETSEVSGNHVVARGDTLWSISRRYGITVQALQRANGLGKKSILRPGQRLLIPAANQ